jgi:hypothetical protein
MAYKKTFKIAGLRFLRMPTVIPCGECLDISPAPGYVWPSPCSLLASVHLFPFKDIP